MNVSKIFFSFLIIYSLLPLSLLCMDQGPTKQPGSGIVSLLSTCQRIQMSYLNDYSNPIGFIAIGLGIVSDHPVITVIGGSMLCLSAYSRWKSLEKIFKKANRCQSPSIKL